ncbi:ArnT family glycosyltransferase [Kaarinaea lacus]
MTVLAEKDYGVIVQRDIGRKRASNSYVYSMSHETKLTFLLISLLVLLVLLTQFVLRDFDNNRLLSWQWAINQHDLLVILLVSVIGFALVYKSCFVHVPINREVLFLIVIALLLGMATWATPEFMVDTGRYFTHAKLISSRGIGYFLSEWGYGINAWTDMPLASVIYGTVFYVFGESRLGIQVVNTCLFSGSIFLTFLIGRELWDAKTGIVAAWLLLAIPFLHVQASQMLVDVPAMFFAMLAILLSIMAVKRSGNGWVMLAAVFIVFALLTKYSVWIALTSIAVLPVALKGCNRVAVVRRLSLIALVAAVILGFVFYVHHPVILKQLKILLDYQLPALQRWQESYVSTFFYQVHPFVSVAALASLYFAVKKKEFVYLIPAGALCVMLVMGVYRARYLIIAFPLLALVAAFGVRQIKDIVLQHFIVRSAVVVSLAVTLIANLNFLQHTSAVNLKNAGHYLNTLDAQNIAAIVLPQPATAVNPVIALPMLDYYTDKPLLRVDGVDINNPFNRTDTATSPLRFTWEVNQYPYPVVDATALTDLTALPPVLILISGDTAQQLPDVVENILVRYEKGKSFAVVDRVFRFQTIITVYHVKASHLDTT